MCVYAQTFEIERDGDGRQINQTLPKPTTYAHNAVPMIRLICGVTIMT